jgi:cytochrome c oxidase cbb3-type subunit 3
MADMPTEFWGGYIAIITIVTLVVLGWFIVDVYFTGTNDPEVSTHVWDENLREGTQPAPMWWFWLILVLMAVSVVYLMLYPGLGAFGGALRWSQGGEIERSLADYRDAFGAERARIAAASIEEIGDDPTALDSGAHLFRVQCAACHGPDGRGQARLFPNLRDAHWQWGGDEAQVRQTITAGRRGVMPPWLPALQDEGVGAVANYVIALAAGRADDPGVADGRMQYEQFCVACHGLDGGGNPLLGAPPFADGAWTYGGEYEDVFESIANGRNGEMPAFGSRLDATQIRLLTAWLLIPR